MTIVQKILARSSGKSEVFPGEAILIKPDIIVMNDYYVYPFFVDMMNEIGAVGVSDPEKVVIGIDHMVPANSIEFADKHRAIRNFARIHGIKNFFDVGRSGINHHAMAEKGFARPGMVYADHDAQATTLGAFGCFAASFGLGLIQALVSGELWCLVPANLKIMVVGEFPLGVGNRDLAHHILRRLGTDGALYKAVEFTGPTIDSMSIDGRMVLCNMIAHCEAKVGIVNPDAKTVEFVQARTREPFSPLVSDTDAKYEMELRFDVSDLEPLVATPHEPSQILPIEKIGNIPVDQVFVGSCASGRMEDLKIMARILHGRRIHPSVRLIIVPPSREVFLEMVKAGFMEAFIESNAIIESPGCGPCGGAQMGLLGEGEVCVTSSFTNIKGRMGSEAAEIYMASPAVCAASAVEGRIADPRKYLY